MAWTGDPTEMAGVTEYAEGYEVELVLWAAGQTNRGERWAVKALNEAGHNCTAIDVLDLIAWLHEHRPDLLEKKKEKP